ncbi:MAG: hypothetical protein ACFFAJ_07580 [Candidatus Hodarchaeota archaeon]
MLEEKIKRLTYLAGIYSIFYSIIGLLGLLSLFSDLFLIGPFIKDPIEPLLLVLIGIVYLRGFLKLIKKNKTGTAFIYVAAIMGIILGILSSLNLMVNGFLGSLSEEISFTLVYDRIGKNFSLIIIVGILSLIPFKSVQSNEHTLVEF